MGKNQSEDKIIVREREKETKTPDINIPKTEQHLDRNFIMIWQRQDENKFMASKELNKEGIKINRKDYKPVYIKETGRRDLEDIYSRFQHTNETPVDYKARSISVGDIITVNNDGNDKSYFVEPIGFSEVPEFTKQMYLVNGIVYDKMQMSEAEIARFEDIYGIDINSDNVKGINKIAVDPGDRDVNGNGISDKYDDFEER
nr:YodL domain-containing protein [uncultured Butyrivibrio sp.]